MAERSSHDEPSRERVLHASRILFGVRAEAILGDGGWRRELKRAYRRRVLETHPDRARSIGRAEAELASEFRAVVEAYRVLLVALDRAPGVAAAEAPPTAAKAPTRRRGSAAPPREPGRASSAPKPPRRAAGVRATKLPARALRLGEFLYFSGRVPLGALVDALAWQRRQRPPVGSIAVECGFLTRADVLEILERRWREGATSVPFAEYAARIGRLTPFARLAVLGRQRRRQRRLGRFFVERGWVTEEELAAAWTELLWHNLRSGAP